MTTTDCFIYDLMQSNREYVITIQRIWKVFVIEAL